MVQQAVGRAILWQAGIIIGAVDDVLCSFCVVQLNFVTGYLISKVLCVTNKENPYSKIVQNKGRHTELWLRVDSCRLRRHRGERTQIAILNK